MGFRTWGFRGRAFWVLGLGRVVGLWDLRVRGLGLGFLDFRVQGLGFGVWGRGLWA